MSLVRPAVAPMFPTLSTGQLERPRMPADDWVYLRNNPKSWSQLRFLNLGLADPADPSAGLTEETSFGGRDYHWIVQGQGARAGDYIGLTRQGTLLMNARANALTDWAGGAMDAIGVAFNQDLSQTLANAVYTKLDIAAEIVAMRSGLAGPHVVISHWGANLATNLAGFSMLCLGSTTLFGYAVRGNPAGVMATGQNITTAQLPRTIGKTTELEIGGAGYYLNTYVEGGLYQTQAITNHAVSGTASPLWAVLSCRTVSDPTPTQIEVRAFRHRERKDWAYEVAR